MIAGPGYAERSYEHIPTTLTLPVELDPAARAERERWATGGSRGELLAVPQYRPTPDFEARMAQYAVLPPGQVPDPRVVGVLGSWQPEGARFLNTSLAGLLGDEQAGGKSVQVALALPVGASVIYICKATAVRDQSRKLKRWRPDFHVSEWKRDDFNRWPARGEIAVVSMDSLPRPPRLGIHDPIQDRRRAVERMLPWSPWGGILVLDEIDNFRAPLTHRRVAAEALASRAGRRWGTTGTPTSNVPENMWEVLRLLRLERCAFRSKGEFDEMCGVNAGREAGERRGRALAAAVSSAVEERLRRVMLRRTWEQLGGLEQPRYARTAIEVDTAALDAIVAQAGGMGAVLDRVRRAGVEDKNALSSVLAALGIAKVAPALDRIQACIAAGAPVITYCFNTQPLEMIQRALGEKCGIVIGPTARGRRYDAIERFVSGQTPVICVSDAAASSIDLVPNEAPYQVVLRLNIAWTPATNKQLVSRARRPGLRWPLIVEDLVADHPVDEHLHQVVAEKDAVIARMGL